MLKSLSLAICALLLSIAAKDARAESTTALELLRLCQGRETGAAVPEFDLGMCAMYLNGLTEMHGLMVGLGNSTPEFCMPKEGVQVEQLMRIFVKYAEAHPESLHVTARMVAMMALKESFPCKPK